MRNDYAALFFLCKSISWIYDEKSIGGRACMKKTIIIVVALIVLFSFVACNNTTQPPLLIKSHMTITMKGRKRKL